MCLYFYLDLTPNDFSADIIFHLFFETTFI
jgi:hypothetical protein